ncbi:hypothetical protein HanPI659440_Chr07g0260321 [Helianthus annuus]|nr:hypothetical protein HanPI659440_Chr07g0260321 [Helianthus annuus]
MGARKDMGKTFSKLTQEEVDSFCEQWGIDPSVNPVAPGCEVDQCPTGSIALYCRHFEVSRVLRFEVLCRALGYDPNLLMFRRFFRLAKNDDWFTFETSQIDVSLISSLVTTLGSWKDRFFWVSELVVHFKMVRRHPDAVLNELEPSESELNEGMLKALRACPSRLRPFLGHLLVFTGVSVLWDKPNQDPLFMRGGQVMSTLDFIKSDDTSDVVLGDTEAIEGEDAITRTAEGRLVPGGKYVNVPNIKGFTKVSSSKPSTRRSSRRLKGPRQSSAVEHLAVVIGKKGKSSGKKVVVSVAGGSSERSGEEPVEGNAEGVYVPNWQKTKASMAAMKKEIEGFAEKEKSWLVKVHELTKRHEIELSNEKKRMEADRLQLKADREALNVQQSSLIMDLKPSGLNEAVCAEVLSSLSKNRSHSGDSEDTFSDIAEGSLEASIEGSKVAGDGGGRKKKKAKKGKKAKTVEAEASTSVFDACTIYS